MSWVEKTDGNRHWAVYRDDAGRRHSKVFARKADAKVWLAAADTDRARGLWVDARGGAMPFRDWAQRWLATSTVRPTTSAGDLGRYANRLAPAFGDLPLKDLTPMRIRVRRGAVGPPVGRHGAAGARAAVPRCCAPRSRTPVERLDRRQQPGPAGPGHPGAARSALHRDETYIRPAGPPAASYSCLRVLHHAAVDPGDREVGGGRRHGGLEQR